MRVFHRFPHNRARIGGCSLAVALVLAAGIAAAADDLTGQASIIDGDTLEIHGNRIRLRGIDAPGKQSAMPGG